MTITSRGPAWRQLSFRFLTLVLGLAVALLMAESALRLGGFGPWPRSGTTAGASEGAHVTDPVVGWSKKAGRFQFDCQGREILVTHWKGDLRAVAPVRRERVVSRPILLLGGSFAYGYCLNDDETMAWRLQAIYPRFEWENRGTIGYGTYQSLLVLERYLAADLPAPLLVIYCFNQFHARRNVMPPDWQYWLAWRSPSETLTLPYVTLEQDGSLRRQNHAYPSWTLKRHSAVITLLERSWNQLRAVGRTYDEHEVMKALLREMDALVRSHDSRFVVMTLGASDDFGFFQREGIAAVDCKPRGRNEGLWLADGHPSARLNAQYADCLRDYLEVGRILR